jgi:hypothetical protein
MMEWIFVLNHLSSDAAVKLSEGRFEDIITGTVHQETIILSPNGVVILVQQTN